VEQRSGDEGIQDAICRLAFYPHGLLTGEGGGHSSKSSENRDTPLPLVASDKKTFNIPDNVHNPAFQVGVSLYFYADKYGNKFLSE